MVVQRDLEVVPEVDHGIKLKRTATVDGIEVVVVKEVEDHVFSQTGPDQSRQAHDQMIREVLLDELFQHPAMQSVRVQPGLVDLGVFVDADGIGKNVDGTDQDEPIATDASQPGDQSFDCCAITRRIPIRDPLLGRGTGTCNQIV